jgi:hypothetical protein
VNIGVARRLLFVSTRRIEVAGEKGQQVAVVGVAIQKLLGGDRTAAKRISRARTYIVCVFGTP